MDFLFLCIFGSAILITIELPLAFIMSNLTITSISWITPPSLPFPAPPVFKTIQASLFLSIKSAGWLDGVWTQNGPADQLFFSWTYASNWFPIWSVINQNARRYIILYHCFVLVTVWCLCCPHNVNRKMINKTLVSLEDGVRGTRGIL